MNGSHTGQVDLNIKLMLAPYGGPGNQRDRERALAYLLAHADEAHPRLLALLDPASGCPKPVVVIDALPCFARPESISVLETLMQTATEAVSLSAGQALGRHPLPEAAKALVRGMRSPRNETVISAADGLLTRGEKGHCAVFIDAMSHSDPEVRYRVLQAAGGLRCLTNPQLCEVASRDPEPMVRDLARTLLKSTSAGD